MRRRKFVKNCGLLMASAMAVPSLAQPGFKYKMGLQLFTIRDAMERDPLDSIKRAKAMGYQDFETYGYEPETDKYYGYKASEFKTILDDLGLSTSSGHYGLADQLGKPWSSMEKYVDACIKGAKALDQSYITWPWLPPERRNLENYQKMPDILNRIGEQVNAAGLGFAYHNHGFDFLDFGGQNGYGIIMDQTDPALVKLQLDMYWAEHSSPVSSIELIDRQPERFVMWHIKDMDKVTRDYTEMGNGSIDYNEILAKASQVGLEYYFIEQGGNYAKDSMQSIKDSANFFKNNLQKYL